MNREVYKQHYEAVLKYILFLTNNEQQAHDLLQETFLKFYKMRVQVEFPRTYLIKIARNLMYDQYRKKRLIQFFSLQQDKRVDDAPLPEMVIERNEENQHLYRALQQLPLKYREVITLRYIEEYSVKEVAAILNCNEIKVKNDTARGLKDLRKQLEGGDLSDRTTTENIDTRSIK